MTDAAAPAPVYAARTVQPAAARDAVLAVWRGNLGDAARMAAKFDWFYGGCPWGAPLLQMLAHGPSGADIGVAAAGPRRMLREGAAIEAGVLVDLAVLPEHRSLGPALLLQQALIEAADSRFELLYGFPNPKAVPVFKRVGYVHLADYHSYVEAQREVEAVFVDRDAWIKKSMLNSARMGSFSSDATIREYARDIWGVPLEK